MPKIRIPTPLRQYAAGTTTVEVTGTTVGEAMDDLTRQFTDLRKHLYTGEELRPYVNIFLNSEDVRYQDGAATTLKPDDVLMIVPSIAGGK